MARYAFTEADGTSYLCSGTLLNNTASSVVPYFLSANHCVSTASTAATMNTYWFYQRSSCGGSSSLTWQQLTRGATLLATSSSTDSSFFRLNEPAPAGAWFAGWYAGGVLPGESIAGIHHPQGDYKKIGFGWVDGIGCWGCDATGAGDYLKVTYSQGLMEPGSSGSGLFTSNEQLVGVLRGGTAAVCGGFQQDWYGRFDLLYPSISAWLNPVVTREISLTGDLTFGAVQVGGLAARTLIIANTGNSPLTVSAITHPTGFSVSWSGGIIPAGGSQVVTVISAPVQTISYGGTVTVHANHTGGTNTVNASATGAILVTPQTYRAAAADLDADGRTDATVWRQTTGTWFVAQSSDGSAVAAQWGRSGDFPVPGDYDGDGKTDFAVWRPSTGVWYVALSSTGTPVSRHWGAGYAPYHDVPVPGDYDGDGKTDFAVWRPSTGVWYVTRSSDAAVVAQHWGDGQGPYYDVPVASDYDGDGKADFAVWRRSTGVWYVLRSSSGNVTTLQWGAGHGPYYDVPALGDYDGDGRTDFTIWRPSTGFWYSIRSSDEIVETRHWGAGYGPYYDYAVPGDYDGDGRTDVAVWRSSTGFWYVISSSDGSVVTRHWGAGFAPYFDVPVPSGGAR